MSLFLHVRFILFNRREMGEAFMEYFIEDEIGTGGVVSQQSITCTCTNTRTHIRRRAYTQSRTFTDACTQTHTWTCTHAHKFIHMCTHIHKNGRADARTHTCAQRCASTRTHAFATIVHICIHTHMQHGRCVIAASVWMYYMVDSVHYMECSLQLSVFGNNKVAFRRNFSSPERKATKNCSKRIQLQKCHFSAGNIPSPFGNFFHFPEITSFLALPLVWYYFKCVVELE